MGQQRGLFDFESGYAGDLRFIPLSIRYRLDRIGLKLGLEAWRGLGLETRRRLLDAAVGDGAGDATFRQALGEACLEWAVPAPASVPPLDPAAWSEAAGPPRETGMDSRVSDGWRSLSDLRRYALFKLARSRREPEALARALGEFFGDP